MALQCIGTDKINSAIPYNPRYHRKGAADEFFLCRRNAGQAQCRWCTSLTNIYHVIRKNTNRSLLWKGRRFDSNKSAIVIGLWSSKGRQFENTIKSDRHLTSVDFDLRSRRRLETGRRSGSIIYTHTQIFTIQYIDISRSVYPVNLWICDDISISYIV